MSDSLWPYESQHARPPCPSPTPRVHSEPCPSSPWCHPAISSSVVPFSSCLQSFPASGSFPMSWLSASGGQSVGALASASILPVNIQGWFPLGLTGWWRWKRRAKKLAYNSTFKKQRSWYPVPTLHNKYKGEKWNQWQIFFPWTLKSLWMVTAAMKLKDACSLEGTLWRTQTVCWKAETSLCQQTST